MNYHIEYEQEEDGRWIAEISALPGVLAYGATRLEARRNAEALAFRVTNEEEGGSAGEVEALEAASA